MAVGVKFTDTVQEEPALSDAPQVLAVMLKSDGSVLVKLKSLKFAVPDPPAVMVKVCAAPAVPTDCDPQEMLDGVIEMVAVGAGVPVPVSATVCGLLPAPSTKLSVEVRVPVAVGAKIRVT